ncbi:threonine aldolase family protein [Chengkuizengella axinellae]|uniref:GntG family PLP-dependent aldolase n=1 Tax=Chengkuizengella axinellae TaxID=3064388 RepID=A0ABT9IZQ5_9BACL|nr:GntG family PLP-dependent aldolase [Chengkuizengella sp. 2205SS18-9]MDP5274854.1 GntG family PLP-dependent aldolase [Chengkuizengella sp. 2205SS18-9]
MIDMRSDTLTKPSEEMREVMKTAIVGDDCYGEDKSVNDLEEYCKDLFEVEGALFIPSGTMANQVAIKAHVDEGNEIITEANYHINFYESASTAILSRAVLNCVRKKDGIITKHDVEELINSKPRGALYSKPQLVSIENTINYYQGKTFPIETIRSLYHYTREIGISLHLDGARLFNAHIATGIPLKEYARNVDSLSVCFAKGLGAPYGSMLMGNQEFIKDARAIRKQFGGGLHQIGIYAAAAQHALDYHLLDIHRDHQLTKELAILLNQIPEICIDIENIETNMIFLDLNNLTLDTSNFIKKCKDYGLLVFDWLPGIVRIVINREITAADIYIAAEIIKKSVRNLTKEPAYA